MSLFALYLLFLKIGIFTFGGGYAMIPLFQSELVTERQLLSPEQFADIIALAQMTPGPVGLNAATYIGQLQGGFMGAFVCTLGVCTPSLTVGILLAYFLKSASGNRWLQGAMTGIRPATIGMIAAAVIAFADASIFTTPFRTLFSAPADFRISLPGVIVFAVTLFLNLRWKLPMLATIAIASIMGLLFSLIS
jgi:chromate transporter